MREPIAHSTDSERTTGDRLNSWKEIAAYLQRDVTTVQRWERREAMPVHRHLHDRMGSVYAFRAELDDWARSRSFRATPDNGADLKQDAEKPESAKLESGSDPATFAVNIPPLNPSASPALKQSSLKLPLTLAIAALALAIGVIFWLYKTERFWKSPIAGAKLQTVAEFEGEALSAAVSHDGHFIALLSDRDGKTDVWITQVGSGAFHNLTQGSFPELVNPSIRTLGFSPDDSLVTFWVRKPGGANTNDISIWAAPVLGGPPKPYLEGVAEFDWSHDGSRLAYHTPASGDPMFVSDGSPQPGAAPIFTAPAGIHSHFPVWAPDSSFLYFVGGGLPDRLDIWRIKPSGRTPERISSQSGQVAYPVFLDRRTLLYLANDSDGAGPRLYSMDVERRIPHRLDSGLDRYTSLAADAGGRRLLFTIASPKRSLWLLQIPASPREVSVPVHVGVSSAGFSPRLGPNYLLSVSAAGTRQSLLKYSNGVEGLLWNTQAGEILLGAPAISSDGQSIAFSTQHQGQTYLYVMRSDGTNARVVCDSLKLQGGPAWEPDGKSLTAAADVQGTPQLFRVPLDGTPPSLLVQEHSVDPAWSPDGHFLFYSGPDIGASFSVKALTTVPTARPLPTLTLTRGARHVVFLPGAKKLVLLRGEIKHKNLWLVDVETGAEQQLTNLPDDFDVRDFDISSDGKQVVFERLQERSDVRLMDLPPR
jgi:Tol biopolymer transport system component